MKRILICILMMVPVLTHAQSPYTNTIFTPAKVMTASAQTSTALQLGTNNRAGSYSAGTITLTGTALTTATFGVLGSADGGVSYFLIPMNTYADPATLATTFTATTNGIYQVSLAGLTHIKFVTSGTFTGTSIALLLTASPNAVLGRVVPETDAGPPTGVAGGDLSGTYPNPSVGGIGGATVPTSAGLVGTNASKQIVAVTALPGTTTATTQAAADNSTLVATTAYADRAATTVGTAVAGGDLSGNYPNPTVAKTGGVAFAPSATTDTTNASNIGSGTLAAARIPTLNQNTTGTAGGLSGTPALPNGTTATTQAAGDNSTKVATTAYADRAVSNAIQEGVTGSIGGSLLTAGSCATGSATVTNSEPAGSPVAVAAADGSAANALVTLSGNVATTGTTVTVNVCAIAAVTPAAKTYNVAVF